MKKIISLLICTLIIMTSICVSATASNNAVELEANGIEYTVEFEDSTLTEEKKNSIANALIGTNESEIMPVNLLCSLFGHDLKNTTATATQHKVKAKLPRCLMKTYDVTYCSRCDYTEQTLLGNSYINCCPED